jgi:kynurenine formamidase
MKTIIDLTQLFYNNMPRYPGDDEPKLAQVKYFAADKYSNFRIESGMHVGTHIDGPMHLTESKKFISDIDISKFIGKGCILDVRGEQLIQWKDQYEKIIEDYKVVLLLTGMSEIFEKPEYFTSHPVISEDFAAAVADLKVSMLGVDFPSVDKSPHNIHKKLLWNNVLIIENLTNLEKLLGKKNFEIIALPLKTRSDSSLARVIAIADE